MALPNGYTNKNVIDKFLRLDLGGTEKVSKHFFFNLQVTDYTWRFTDGKPLPVDFFLYRLPAVNA